jgi:hypothetical protein
MHRQRSRELPLLPRLEPCRVTGRFGPGCLASSPPRRRSSAWPAGPGQGRYCPRRVREAVSLLGPDGNPAPEFLLSIHGEYALWRRNDESFPENYESFPENYRSFAEDDGSFAEDDESFLEKDEWH